MRARTPTLEVILANVNCEDRVHLEEILHGTPWVVVGAELPELGTVVHEASVPIVLCGQDPSNCWRQTIRNLIKVRRDVCVILLSGEVEVPGSEEVVRYGAFDMLLRPLQRKQVLPLLIFAYAYWRGHGHLLSRPRRQLASQQR